MADADRTPPIIAAGTEGLAAEAQATHERGQPAARRRLLLALGGAVLAIAAVYLLWNIFVGSRRVSTDNAYVGAEIAQVTPLVAGAVTAVRVRETQAVKRGDVLVTLDPADARIAVAQAEADLFRARQRYAQTGSTSASLAATVRGRAADIATARAKLDAADADLERATIDAQRRRALAPDGAVSGDELSSAANALARARAARAQAAADLDAARAARAAAQQDFAANEALVRGTTAARNPDVSVAEAKLDAARLALARTIIRAPIDGIVAGRKVQLGQQIAAGTQIMQIVPERQVYVDANFKEGQLARVRVGQPVTLTSDLYGGDVTYHGHVTGFGGGTGAAFSVIPAQNATGNWIKVVQRLPIRVALDPDELARHPLRVGLSMIATIDLR